MHPCALGLNFPQPTWQLLCISFIKMHVKNLDVLEYNIQISSVYCHVIQKGRCIPGTIHCCPKVKIYFRFVMLLPGLPLVRHSVIALNYGFISSCTEPVVQILGIDKAACFAYWFHLHLGSLCAGGGN